MKSKNDQIESTAPKFMVAAFFSLLFFIYSTPVQAYELHKPIQIKNIQATPENPYIIEGYEISNPSGDCINIINSKNIIIKNNYLHDCGADKNFQKNTDHYREGYAVLVGDSTGIIFEDNILDNNFRGFMAYNSPGLKARKNKITNTIQYSPLWCERCSDSEFSSNYLSDNGNPMHFWVPSDRSIGIWIKRSDNVKIHDNTVIRSTSDGISVTGHIYIPSFTAEEDRSKPHPQADWGGLSNNSEIYNNLILDNMEQGVWLVNARGIKVHDNIIRTGCFTYGSPISTEFNVGDSEFYNNKILGCLNAMVGGANSFNIYIHDNIFYSFDGSENNFASFSDESLGVGDLARRQDAGAIIPESIGNTEKNNTRVLLKGKLAEEMKEKIEYAKEHKTYEAKGWIACEQDNGNIDEQCKQREEAKGDQGVPKEQLFYSSLMEDFEAFADNSVFQKISSFLTENKSEEKEIVATSGKKNEKKGIFYIVEQLLESWKATLGAAIFIVLLVIIGYNIKKKKRSL